MLDAGPGEPERDPMVLTLTPRRSLVPSNEGDMLCVGVGVEEPVRELCSVVEGLSHVPSVPVDLVVGGEILPEPPGVN